MKKAFLVYGAAFALLLGSCASNENPSSEETSENPVSSQSLPPSSSSSSEPTPVETKGLVEEIVEMSEFDLAKPAAFEKFLTSKQENSIKEALLENISLAESASSSVISKQLTGRYSSSYEYSASSASIYSDGGELATKYLSMVEYPEISAIVSRVEGVERNAIGDEITFKELLRKYDNGDDANDYELSFSNNPASETYKEDTIDYMRGSYISNVVNSAGQIRDLINMAIFGYDKNGSIVGAIPPDGIPEGGTTYLPVIIDSSLTTYIQGFTGYKASVEFKMREEGGTYFLDELDLRMISESDYLSGSSNYIELGETKEVMKQRIVVKLDYTSSNRVIYPELEAKAKRGNVYDSDLYLAKSTYHENEVDGELVASMEEDDGYWLSTDIYTYFGEDTTKLCRDGIISRELSKDYYYSLNKYYYCQYWDEENGDFNVMEEYIPLDLTFLADSLPDGVELFTFDGVVYLKVNESGHDFNLDGSATTTLNEDKTVTVEELIRSIEITELI